MSMQQRKSSSNYYKDVLTTLKFSKIKEKYKEIDSTNSEQD